MNPVSWIALSPVNKPGTYAAVNDGDVESVIEHVVTHVVAGEKLVPAANVCCAMIFVLTTARERAGPASCRATEVLRGREGAAVTAHVGRSARNSSARIVCFSRVLENKTCRPPYEKRDWVAVGAVE